MKWKISYNLLLLLLFVWSNNSCAEDFPVEIVIQSGHSRPVTSVALSADGKYLATGSEDNTVKLWDVQTGREIRTFTGHSGVVTSVAFSANCKQLVTGSLDGTAKLWDIETGREILALSGHKSPVNSVAFSADSKYIVTGSRDWTTKLWDFQTGREILTFYGHSDGVTSVAFSADSKYLITGSWDKTAKLWEVQTGREIRTFSGHSSSVRSVAISTDGKYVVTGSWDKTAKLWDVKTGGEIRTFSGHKSFVTSVAYKADGKYLVTGSEDGTAKLWDIESGQDVRTFFGHTSSVNSVAISADCKYLVTGSEDGTAKLWDIESGQDVRTFFGHSSSVKSIAISADGKYLVTGSEDGTAKFWDIEADREVRSFFGHSIYVKSVAISDDGKYLVIGSEDGTAKLWDIETGREMRSFSEHISSVSPVALSADGKYLVTVSRDKIAKLWNVKTGRKIHTITGILLGTITSVAFSADGKYFVIARSGGTVKLRDVRTGRYLHSFSGHKGSVSSVAFSADGKYLMTGSWDKTAKLWNAKTGRIIHTFAGHSDYINSVAFSADARYVMTGSKDGTAKLWDVRTGKELVTLFPIGGLDWTVTTTDGYFDCSKGAKKYIHFVKGTDVFELDQFFEDFYRPDLLAEVMSGKELKRPELNLKEKLVQSPPPAVEIVSPKPGETFTQKKIELVLKITDNGGGIDEVVLLHNGKRVAEDNRGFQIAEDSKKSFIKKYKVHLLKGDNIFHASAFSKERIESRAYELTVAFKGVTATANSYVFVIGINKYKNPKYELNYAQADAAGVKELLVERSAKLFKQTYVYELYNNEATSNNIRSMFDQIISRAQPQDVFTFYYAGHGVMLPDEKGKDQFYLIPFEVTSLYDDEKIHQSGISGKQLVQFSQNIAARKQLFIIDACQAGGISESFAMRGFAEEKALAQLARSAGIHVIASSQSDQYASEFSQLGHGLFTYALLQALGGKAEAPPPDRMITVREINVYLENVIPDLGRKYKGQAQYPVIYSNGQDFPVVIK